MAGTGLLAYILVSKFDDYLPLYRLNETFARKGADIPDSTMVDRCVHAMQVLQPLIERIETAIMTRDLRHADDTRSGCRIPRCQARAGQGCEEGQDLNFVRDQRP
ncbi:hypothetical protein CUJ84_pRLN3000391 (plasmid) [Rhizobium leguminosarum]|uniref:Transposase IS66 central domain-containing protein n=1 Tax=Rhizobium leguminosarum TaxID=384 RepID=A0A2K9ZHJ1_RHILE|nr:hypothetical protein CUJ84_pRLN3000391 [Rhizobium leguminosarum]